MSTSTPASTRLLTRPEWGGWHLDVKERTLDLYWPGADVSTLPEPRYFIRLDKKRDSASVLDSIMQIIGKRFATPEVLAGLVRAFDDVLDPQSRMCSFGSNRVVSPRQLDDLIRSAQHRSGHVLVEVA